MAKAQGVATQQSLSPSPGATSGRRQRQTKAHVKDDTLSHLIHELRAPLQIITGYAEILLGMGDPSRCHLAEEQRTQVEQILHAGQYLKQIIESAQDLSLIASGTLEMQRRPIDCAAFIAELLCQFAPLAADHHHQLIEATALDVPTIAIDPGHLRQILSNLIANAIKFTPAQGTITVGALPGPESTVDFFVRDTGPGIAKKHHKAIFLPYRQVTRREDLRRQGTGIGLALVQRLAQLYHGSAWVESVYRHGSTFWVRLPRQESTTA